MGSYEAQPAYRRCERISRLFLAREVRHVAFVFPAREGLAPSRACWARHPVRSHRPGDLTPGRSCPCTLRSRFTDRCVSRDVSFAAGLAAGAASPGRNFARRHPLAVARGMRAGCHGHGRNTPSKPQPASRYRGSGFEFLEAGFLRNLGISRGEGAGRAPCCFRALPNAKSSKFIGRSTQPARPWRPTFLSFPVQSPASQEHPAACAELLSNGARKS